MSSNVDGRYPGYLPRLEQTEPVPRILVVDAIGEMDLAGSKSNELIESFASWYAIDMTRRNGVLGIVHYSSGYDLVSLWDLLRTACDHVGVTWVVSYQCVRAWALLGLWGRLEHGSLRVSGGDYRSMVDMANRASATSPGLLIAEDPPCIAQLRIGTQPGSLMWLDVRNWGIELSHLLDRGKDICECITALLQRMESMCEQGRLATLATTAASHAYRTWRTIYRTHAVHTHVHPDVLALESAAHVGGRCECLQMGRISGPVYHLDIRSCYGWVMSERLLPVRLLDYRDAGDLSGMHDKSILGCAIAKVTLHTAEPAYPYCRDDDTIYPTGTTTTTLCGPELMDAAKYGRIRHIHCIARYACEPVLKDYAVAVYRLRQTAEHRAELMLASWCKCLLNAIVGKAAQKIKRWEVVLGGRAPEPWGEWQHMLPDGSLERWRALAGVCQREIEGGYGPYAVPAIAAWICSAGRMRLLQMIRIAEWPNVYYCDTDSLLCNAIAAEKLMAADMIRSGQIGCLEIRGIPANVEIRGIKYYLEDDDVTCAGVQRGVVVRSHDGLGEWVIPHGSAGTKLGHATGTKRKLIKWPKPAPYRHGIVGDDGRVSPIHIEED